ncbi:MAG: hypothetical protein H6737_11740 [Alphaproteobacteria bacterium]|nr:hypothetical protein [Alphaproteobacteria bacterium]
MDKAELLEVVKDLATEVTASETNADEAATRALRAELDASIRAEAPLTELGWDSVRLTWLLVRIEERFDIDTSTLSLYDLFTVDDLLVELKERIEAR